MKNLTKTTLLMSLLCLIHHKAVAQINLVPNPSFEEYEWCPTGFPDLDGNLKYWKSYRGTPDYFNVCSPICGFKNQFGYQTPRLGNAYIGLLNFDNYNGFTEHLGVQLVNPLSIGQRYYVSFYVSLAYTPLLCNVASNKVGVKFTTFEYRDPIASQQLSNNCQIFTNQVLKDTLNWTKISGSFISDSAYEYLIIGGHFESKYIDTALLPYEVVPQISYYYIDDVCVSEDSSLCFSDKAKCDFILPTAFSPNGDNANDIFYPVFFDEKINIIDFRIYNQWGQIIHNDPNTPWNGTYKGEPQPQGVYAFYLKVKNEKTGKTEQRSGSFTLLR